MDRITKHRIAIRIFRDELDDGPIRFNPKQAFLLGKDCDWSLDAETIYLVHPEFPRTPEGSMCLAYPIDKAQIKFPYLFKDTNPILYRQFD